MTLVLPVAAFFSALLLGLSIYAKSFKEAQSIVAPLNIVIIFPAIDIKDGKCVRLIKGDFNKIIFYEDSPDSQAIKYSQSGFNDIHIVDLDGALQGKPVNSIIVKEIIKKS